MASDMELWMKQRCGVEFLHAENITPIDVHWCLLNVYRDQTVGVSTVRWCVSAVVSLTVGHLCWYRCLQAQHSGFCPSLGKKCTGNGSDYVEK